MPPWYANITALVLVAIPTYLWRVTVLGLPTTVFELLVGGLVVVGFIHPPIRHEWRVAERSMPRTLVVLIGLFVLSAFISTLISDVPRVSFGIFKSWIILPLLLGWIVYASPRVENYAIRMTHALLLSGVLVSLLSLLQFQWGHRLAGIYDVPASLALYITPLLVASVWLALSIPHLRLWYGAAALLLGVILLATESLAGLTTALLVITTATLLRSRRKMQILATILGVMIIIGMSVSYLFGTGRVAYLLLPITTGEANSLSVRLQLWSVSLDLIRERPLLGVGLGQFEPAYQEKLHERFALYNQQPLVSNIRAPLPEFVYRDPHNWVLSFWLNTGLMGLLTFIGLHAWTFRRSRPLFATNHHAQTAALVVITLLIMGLIETIYWKNDLAALHWLGLAFLLRGQEQR